MHHVCHHHVTSDGPRDLSDRFVAPPLGVVVVGGGGCDTFMLLVHVCTVQRIVEISPQRDDAAPSHTFHESFRNSQHPSVSLAFSAAEEVTGSVRDHGDYPVFNLPVSHACTSM